MIVIGYLILAVIVMGFSIQLSNYVDIIDKRTSISGAFLFPAHISPAVSSGLFLPLYAILPKKPLISGLLLQRNPQDGLLSVYLSGP